ncbi:MAG: cadmium resistance transporter [Levilactobacillus sp.]|uniref:cadmium resistance transporter n=1 Tax=Levilactobacillus sp. TaxID=2767919 RepID=UPI0025866B78|nr:cadmium resistance transporter [Levilactobacillus sp.]MCI1553650.1 cadmium resistance transporter [Levilactobacillus sp.]MCI1598601.1 cadmium resistance transporter [Levilactobacillus sp.]MCI1605249.1 cadmium resistance transporter [Levilactobacillus sp.]
MSRTLSFILTAVGIFFVTDTDDLVVLLLLWLAAATPLQRRHVVVGQYLGISTLILVSWLVSRGILHYNVGGLVHWLGLVPLSLGIVGIARWWRNRGVAQLPPTLTHPVSLPLVWSLTLGNGGDNLSIYIPYFTHLDPPEFAVVLVVFLSMIGLWLLLSHHWARSTVASHFFARFGAWLSPLLFIGIGLAIVLK